MLQPDAIGTAIAGGLTGLAMTRIWRDNRSSQVELDADEGAIRVALRRGYNEAEAAGHLLGAIQAVAQIEGRSLDFNELIRCQNLKAISGISAVCPIVSGKIRKYYFTHNPVSRRQRTQHCCVPTMQALYLLLNSFPDNPNTLPCWYPTHLSLI